MLFIWLVTILCTVAYIVSIPNDHELETILLPLVAKRFKHKIIKVPKDKYIPIFVNESWILNNIGAFILNRSLISNWSKGLYSNIEEKFDWSRLYMIQLLQLSSQDNNKSLL